MKVLTAEQMRWVEQQCAGMGITPDVLMENAGRAVADMILRLLDGAYGRRVVLLVGLGNNGGDGLVAARHLRDWGADVRVFLPGRNKSDDPNLELVQERGIPCDDSLDGLDDVLNTADVVVDALFGTGRSRQLKGIFKQALHQVAAIKCEQPKLKVVAVDLPSGLDADSGACDPACLACDHSLTLGCPKLGLYSFPGAAKTGLITVVDIGIPDGLTNDINIQLIDDDWARTALPRRPVGANKGSFGRVLLVAGSKNYIGAAYLACSGAYRAGAGLVTLATAGSLTLVIASWLAEVTYLPLPESAPGVITTEAAGIISNELDNYNVLLIGCGLGQSRPAVELVGSLLLTGKELPGLVLDADALNTLAATPGWWRKLPAGSVLTPHPGEMARLTGMEVAEIQADRPGVARRHAAEWGQTVVLKGAYTVIAAADGRCFICPLANAGLATAGTGDVLAGVIAGLVAQGLNGFDAAVLGVWLHARAGEEIKDELGDAGMLAGDLLPALPKVIKAIKEG